MKKNHLAIYTGVALLFLASGAYVNYRKQDVAPIVTTPPATATPSAADPVKAFYTQSLPDTEGKMQALAQWKGKALIVNFWAPWCAPCVKEMPELSALQGEIASKNIQVIGVGIDSPSNLSEFATRFKIAYPVYVAGMGGTDLMRNFGNLNGGLPFTVLIGADGKVKKTYLARLKFDELRKDLTAL
jgi:thiol-disulfide isomerase/thioredoxin